GTLTLSGSNTYTGGSVINAGTITAGSSSANALGTGSITLGDSSGGSNNATLLISVTGLTYSNAIVLASTTSGTLSLGNTGTAISTTFSGGITGTNNLTINSNATTGTITFTTNSINNAGTVTNTGAGSGTTSITAVIGSNVTNLIQNSSTSSLQISNTSNAYGSTTISLGTLKLGAAAAIPDSSAVSITGTLDLNSYSETVGSITGSGTITSSATGTPTLTVGSNNSDTTFSGVIQNGISTVALTKSGSGTLTLSGANTYTGLTTVSAGTLAYGVSNAIYTGAVTVNGSTAVLALGVYTDTVGGVTLTEGQITGTGSSTQGILTGTSYTINPGTGVTVSVSANLAGAVNLTHSGAGTANLSGYNAYSGTTTLNTSGGILAITGSGTLSGTSSGIYSGAIAIGTGTTFKYSSSANQTLQTGVISGAGNLTKDTDASSVLTLTATNTYTGVTTINAGTLSVATIGSGGVAGNLGQATNSATNIVLGGGTLKYTGSTASINCNIRWFN
ncbi:MAG: hypothetical protein EBU65_03055, partial [Actinobacteria bacterium]|nr:hypothetical protein [Actinomycetota bacterium]